MDDYFNINKDVWQYFKKYLDAIKADSLDSSGWKQLMVDAYTIEKKYNSEYCHELIMAQINELDRIHHDTIKPPEG